MNVSSILTTDYENKSNWTLGENKPNSNPIKPNFRKAQMNVSSLITKDYIKYDDFAVPKNKPNSNPNKPKQSQFQTGHQPPPTPYLPPQFSLKFTLKNAPATLRIRYAAREIFKKLLICTCFYSIIVLFYALYTERHIYWSNMRKA